MTACVNKNHGRRVAGVVTASLVGALTLGGVSLAAVPTVALAEQAGVQAIQPWGDFKLTGATDGQGNQLTGDLYAMSFAYTGNASQKYLVPTSFTGDSYTTDTPVATALNVTYDLSNGLTSGEYSWKDSSYENGWHANVTVDATKVSPEVAAKYFAGELYVAGQPSSPVRVAAGNYTVNFAPKSGNGSIKGVTFGVTTSAPVAKLTVTDADGNADLAYDGYAQTLSLKNADGSAAASGAYKVYEVKSDGSEGATEVYSTTSGNTIQVTNAGKYVVKKGSDVVADFEVAKLDLAAANLRFDDTNTVGSTDLKTFYANGKSVSVDPAKVTITVSGPSANLSATGEYTVTLAAKDEALNFKGTGSYKFTKLDDAAQTISKVYYGRKDVTSTGVEVAKGSKFDGSKVIAEISGTKYDASKLTVTYTKDGKEFDASKAVAGDKFQMNVKLTPYNEVVNGSTVLKGSKTVTIDVKMATSEAYDDQLGFYLDGKLAGSKGEVSYDGTDQLARLTTVFKDDDGNTLVEGTDYELKVTNGKGAEVDKAVDADVYTVEVVDKGAHVNITGTDTNKFMLSVKPADVSSVYNYVEGAPASVKDSVVKVEDARLFYNGSDLATPAYKYYVLDSKGNRTVDEDGNYVVAEVPADAYNVVSVLKGDKAVSAIKGDGTYTVNVAFKDASARNYSNGGVTSFKVTVKKAQPFADVAPEAWYAKGVYNAWRQVYVNGIADTNLFAPEAKITRADATVILFNMAGGKNKPLSEFQYDNEKGFVTGFSDVDGHAYYAKAIAWAKAMGVATGDAGTTNFRPTDSISRQEFAALLVKYAKATGRYVAPTADELSKLADAGTVDGWARDAVNWAVANKVMGNGGYVAGTSDIKRAEVATMAVNYQPENVDQTIVAEANRK